MNPFFRIARREGPRSEQGFAFERAYGTLMRGWALAQQGRLEEGIAGMRRAVTASEAMRGEGSQLLCNGDLEA